MLIAARWSWNWLLVLVLVLVLVNIGTLPRQREGGTA
jgi:hypothetical protein